MIKFKSKIKDCQLIVRARLPFGTVLNENELNFFARKYLSGFLKPKRVRKSVLEYTGPVSISLHERLKKPISKYDFFFLVEQIVDGTRRLQEAGLASHKICWNLNEIYINETTKEVQLLFLPIERVENDADAIDIIRQIIYQAQPMDEHDTEYSSRLLYFLKSLQEYDAERIERFIFREDRDVVNKIRRHNGGSGFITDKPRDYYAHLDEKNQNDEDTMLLEKEEETGILTEDEETGLLNTDEEETSLLSEDEDGTTVLVEDNSHYPTLCRMLTNEIISVNKPVFRLGKERSYVDYFVNNNSAVSRSHADIITRVRGGGTRYFVKDLNSKNKTFIDGRAIPSNTEIEIFDGSQLKLANEIFVFNL